MRLLSWNIHKGIGGRDRRYSLLRIIDCIEAENPDLVCLQEVDRLVRRSRNDDQPRLLARHFRCHAVFQATVPVGGGGYGNLVLSRWPVASRHRITLRQGARKPRGAQLLLVDTPEGPLHLVHTHLGLAEQERRWQVSRMLGHMLFRSADRHPALVVGDFNDWRDTLSGAELAAAGFAQVTAPASRFRTFPSWLPIGALDKAFVRGGVDVRHARVVRTSLAKTASDHLPLVIDFHLR
ncbi:MAG: endonuclease [Planctomycetota bacterium]|jgi:endonuclease/exonuclease/phosphatase family metal-dependent hydrolase|nr:MAG: endonuclease [Planctomycetota bacterium]